MPGRKRAGKKAVMSMVPLKRRGKRASPVEIAVEAITGSAEGSRLFLELNTAKRGQWVNPGRVVLEEYRKELDVLVKNGLLKIDPIGLMMLTYDGREKAVIRNSGAKHKPPHFG